MKQKNWFFPEIISFANGALVMIFEILGARIVWPHIGTSLFVWTSLIASILGSLSLWYYLGGRIADKQHNKKILAFIYLLVSSIILLLFIIKDPFIDIVSTRIPDIRMISFFVCIVLFWPVSLFFGMASPIITKSKLESVKTGGKTIGTFESIGTIGSITGTVSAGFFLIPFFWVNELLLSLGIVALILSFYIERKVFLIWQWILVVIYVLCFSTNNKLQAIYENNNIHFVDSFYSHIMVFNGERKWHPTRELKVDNISHAGMYTDSSELLYDYTKYYHLLSVFTPEAKNVLMLWGAAYSFPKSFLETYGDKNLDVVEIDPKMTEIAKKYFHLPDSPRLQIYHEDARVYLNQTEKKYDTILGDAFWNYYSVPYQLTTQEVVKKSYNLLEPNGVLILNIIGSIEGKYSQFIQAEYKTYASVFPQVYLIPVSSSILTERQNIMLVAFTSPLVRTFTSDDLELQSYLNKMMTPKVDEETQILTDNYAPVDYFVSKMIY